MALLSPEWIQTYQDVANKTGKSLEMVVTFNMLAYQLEQPGAPVLMHFMAETALLPNWDTERAIEDTQTITKALTERFDTQSINELVDNMLRYSEEAVPYLDSGKAVDRHLLSFSKFFKELSTSLRE